MTGPVQVLVVGFDRDRLSGEVLAELERLREAGIVRLVDVLLVTREESGEFDALPPPPGADSALGRIAAELLGAPAADGVGAGGGAADGTPDAAGEGAATWSLADSVPPGSSAAIALIEHLWAGPLVAAIRAAGGQPLDDTWLSADDVEELERLESAVRG